MSVLIKGMEMPKGCASCFLKYGWCSSIRKRMDESRGDRWCPQNYRHPDCPLIEVPEDVQPVKHGSWIEYPECLRYENAFSSDHIVCSCCEAVFNVLDNCTECFVCCPNCGAKMDGEING